MSFFSQFPKTTYDFSVNGIDTKIIDLFRFIKINDRILDDVSLYQYYQIVAGDRPDIVSQELYGTPIYYWTFFIVNEALKSGLTAWPMRDEEFNNYMDLEYSGTVIETRPVVVYDGDGIITEYRNSISDRFSLQETITGQISGATGILVSKDVQMSQLVLRDVVGTFEADELVVGSISSDSVSSFAVYDRKEAPHHYEDASGLVSYNALHIDEQLAQDEPITPRQDGSTTLVGSGGIQPGTSNSELTAISNKVYEMQLNDERSNIRVIRKEFIYEFAKTFGKLINA